MAEPKGNRTAVITHVCDTSAPIGSPPIDYSFHSVAN